MQQASRLLAVVVILGLMTGAPPGHAQAPTPTPTATASSGSTPGAPGAAAPGEDEALYSCKKRTGQVAVTFKPETELKDLITWVMGFTCKNFILDPRVVSTGKKVTVIAPVKMTANEAYRVFLVALSTMGLTIVPKGNVMRIVESAMAKSETVPIFKRGVPPDEDQVVRYILRPTYTQVETLRQALDSVRSPAGSVLVAGTMLVITDYASQVRDMMSLARSIDVPGGSDGIYTIPVHHADAAQLAQKLNDILGITAAAQGAGQRRPPTNVPAAPGMPVPQVQQLQTVDDVAAAVPSKILVDDRTNTLIVVSSEAGYLRVKALVDRLDIALDTESGQAIHVYPLENALAEELATTLNNAMGQASARPGQQPGRPGQPGQPGVPQIPQPVPQSSVTGLDNLGASLEGQVRVIGDKPTNSLIVMSSGRDFIAIKDVVRRLDQPRKQVFIEAVILEVQLTKNLQVGSSSHGGLPVDGSNALLLGGVQSQQLRSISAASSLATATGLIGGLIGSPLANSQTFLGTSIPSFAVLFQALATQDNSDILSAPNVIALDNEKTEFSVGNNIPYKAGLSFGGFGLPGATGGATGSNLPTGSIGQNIQRQDLNLTLNVTPHISSQDVVRLDIEQETKDQAGSDAELGPTWSQRKLKTGVVVHDQQSVVIGGLIQERDSYSVTKVPLLGDIPILGYLFKYSIKTKKKTNLVILLTPYIIKDQLDLQSIRERKLRERTEFVESFATLNEMKYESKVDYRRKRGLVEEINRQLQIVDEDAAAQNALGRRRFVDPGPVEYGPSQIESPEEGHGSGQTRPQTEPAAPARPPGKAPGPVRPAPKAEPKAEPKSQLDPAAPSDKPNGKATDKPDKSSKASKRGKPNASQVASNPADRAAEGLATSKPSKSKKSTAKLASNAATKPASSAAAKPVSNPADRAAEGLSRSKLPRRSHTLRDLSPAAAPGAQTDAAQPQKGAR